MSEDEIERRLGDFMQGRGGRDPIMQAIRSYGDTRERAGIERAKEAARGVAGVPRHTWNDYMNRRWEGAMDCVRAIESLPVPAPEPKESEVPHDPN